MALLGLPDLGPESSSRIETGVDLAVVSVSSLYDGGQNGPSSVVPAVLASGSVYGSGIKNLIGCYAGGIVSCRRPTVGEAAAFSSSDVGDDDDEGGGGGGGGTASSSKRRQCVPLESEGIPGVSVTLAILPGVNVKVRTMTTMTMMMMM